jgi:hypothetical protein
MPVWVEDVDEVHRQCVAAGLDVTFPPDDMPWHVREMRVRHPDGHVFRVSKGTDAGARSAEYNRAAPAPGTIRERQGGVPPKKNLATENRYCGHTPSCRTMLATYGVSPQTRIEH